MSVNDSSWSPLVDPARDGSVPRGLLQPISICVSKVKSMYVYPSTRTSYPWTWVGQTDVIAFLTLPRPHPRHLVRRSVRVRTLQHVHVLDHEHLVGRCELQLPWFAKIKQALTRKSQHTEKASETRSQSSPAASRNSTFRPPRAGQR